MFFCSTYVGYAIESSMFFCSTYVGYAIESSMFFTVHMSVMLLNRVCFSQCISICCKKAVWQLDALVCISKHSSINSSSAIYNSLIMSNFNHCPLLWHFCGQVRNQKKRSKEEVLEYCLPITIQELLEQAGTITLLIQQFLLIALTVFESLHVLTPECIKMIVHPFLCAISDAWLQFVRSITLQNHNI